MTRRTTKVRRSCARMVFIASPPTRNARVRRSKHHPARRKTRTGAIWPIEAASHERLGAHDRPRWTTHIVLGTVGDAVAILLGLAVAVLGPLTLFAGLSPVRSEVALSRGHGLVERLFASARTARRERTLAVAKAVEQAAPHVDPVIKKNCAAAITCLQ